MDSNLSSHSMTQPASPKTAVQPRSPGRVVVLDVIKGIAICLMVLGHVTQGLAHMNVVAPGSLLAGMDNFVYRFHMHAFFFASGAVLALHAPANFPTLVSQRLRTLYYPHIVWGVVAYIVAVLFVRYFNSPIDDPGNIGRHAFEIATGRKSWFLVTLLLATVLIYPVMQWNALVAVVVALAVTMIPTNIVLLGYLLQLTVFLALGYAAIGKVLAVGSSLPALVNAAIAIVLFVIVALVPGKPAVLGHFLPLYQFLLGVLGTIALCALSFAILPIHKVSGFFVTAGLASLVIFLLHSFAIGAARAILLRIVPAISAELATLAITIVGILLPMAVYLAVRRLGWNWVFAWPARKRAASLA